MKLFKKGKGFWKFIFIMLLILTILVVALAYLKIIDMKKYADKLKSLTLEKAPTQVNIQSTQPPPEVVTWCTPQVQPPPLGVLTPITVEVLGWDSVNSCCITEVKGYNCALEKNSAMQYCYTANIGGEVKWVVVDSLYVEKTYKDKILSNYHKSEVGDCCKTNIYPSDLVSVEEDCEEVVIN